MRLKHLKAPVELNAYQAMIQLPILILLDMSIARSLTLSTCFVFFFFSFYQLNCSYLLRFERVTVIKPTLLYFTRIIHSENVIFNESSNGI